MLNIKKQPPKKKIRKIFLGSLLVSSIFAINSSTAFASKATDNEQVITKKEKAIVEFNGRVGEMDPGQTDPEDPDVPGPGMDWIKVKLPLKIKYYSTARSEHKIIDSNQYKVENLSAYPVEINLSGFVRGDGASPPDTTGLTNLEMELKDKNISLITNGVANSFNASDKSEKIYTLGPGSKTPAPGSFEGPSSESFSFSGSTQKNIDLLKAVTLNNQLNFTLTALDGNGTSPADQTTVNVHDSTISVGDNWTPADNYDGGTNESGDPLPIDSITIGGDAVDTTKVGAYKVTYSYKNVTQTATITVEESSGPTLPGNDGQIDFMDLKWDVIKGPEKMGEGNYLVALDDSIDNTYFHGSEENTDYFPTSLGTSDGYQDSHVKTVVDNWYNTNIKDTEYERYVQPVILSNPTRDVVMSESELGLNGLGLATEINPPDAYPTIVDANNGLKQAFLMSGSDVADKRQKETTFLTENAIKHKNNLHAKKIDLSFLRTPGFGTYSAGALEFKRDSISGTTLFYARYVVPSLVLHIK